MASIPGEVRAPEVIVSGDRSELTRRLSDKILSAFNHAYAIGEIEIARRLRDVLAKNEVCNALAAELRDQHDPLGMADLWVEFVETRNRYKWVCDHHRSEPGAAEEALEAMKEAYRRWSQS